MEKYTVNGTTYTLTQEPYIDGIETPIMTATAEDEEGNAVMLGWPAKENWQEIVIESEESDAFDWEHTFIICEL